MTKTAERGFGIIKAISEMISSTNELRGTDNEQYAHQIVLDLSQKGLIPHKREELPYLTKRWSDKDREGYDLMIPTDLGEIGLQIKSSWVGKKFFIKRFLRNRDFPYIPCVVVSQNPSKRAQITEQIRRICWREYYMLQKKQGIKTTL